MLFGSDDDEPKAESLGKIKQRHNQEKTALKLECAGIIKNAGKDKKHAKLKIAQLEIELKTRQQNEIQDRENQYAVPNKEPQIPFVKGPSKKQRQLQKRLAADLESKRQLDQELENVVDYRQIECDKLESKLLPLNLTIIDVRPDGHCLYHAIAHQLKLCGLSVPQPGYLHLRNQASDYIRKHPEDFVLFLLTDDGQLMTTEQFSRYCDAITNMSEVLWGGQPEISALASVYKCQIVVYSAEAEPIVMSGAETTPDSMTLRLSFHRHILMGNHYNSVVSI